MTTSLRGGTYPEHVQRIRRFHLHRCELHATRDGRRARTLREGWRKRLAVYESKCQHSSSTPQPCQHRDLQLGVCATMLQILAQ